jgi:hypothetical protein
VHVEVLLQPTATTEELMGVEDSEPEAVPRKTLYPELAFAAPSALAVQVRTTLCAA